MRDSQKAKLYRADDALSDFKEPLPTVKDVERFVKKVWNSGRVQKAFPTATRTWSAPPRVKDGRGTRVARGWTNAISIPGWARRSDVVLHELAHSIHRREGLGGAGHGWEYCSVLLTLTLYVFGRDAHDALKAAYKANRVKFRAPKKRAPLSEERRSQLRAQLAVARAARTNPTKD
jgi:putative metallohydrolase (TIGR04338 family)